MVQYRRNFVRGGTYFFTLALHDRAQTLLVDHVDFLRSAFDAAKQRSPFRIDAIVVLPDHLHTIWTLPGNDADFSGRWQLIKSRFTRALTKSGVTTARNRKGEYNVWQRRFWEHTIRNDEDYERHVDYIRYNPVKHGYVTAAKGWPYSSFHRYVAAGMLPIDWAGIDARADEHEYGE